MLAPGLAETLRQRRDALNASFAAARRRWPHLASDEFASFLNAQLSPLIEAVSEAAPDGTDLVSQTGYELGLQLVAEKIAGPSAIHPVVNQLWQHVLPRLAPRVVAAPKRVLASLNNAVFQLAGIPGTQPSGWLEQLARLGARCADADQLLALGQILAWRAGLSHYRLSALAAGDRLPAVLAIAALDAPADASWSAVQAMHIADPWFGYDEEGARIEKAPFARRVGSFRGFGGLFPTPPIVTAVGKNIVVRCGNEGWVLLADVFGATFHRAAPEELNSPAETGYPRTLSVNVPTGHTITSGALLSHTYALTTAQSHAVWIGAATLS